MLQRMREIFGRDLGQEITWNGRDVMIQNEGAQARPPLSNVLLVVLAVFVESEPELLDGSDDDLVCLVVGLEAADKRRGVCVFLDAVLLEPVELLPGLAVEVLAVDDEEALVDALVGLEERRGLDEVLKRLRLGRRGCHDKGGDESRTGHEFR
jgi:hypothetical protein